MAFTATQKAQIRHFLGFPDVFQGYNSRLENAMDLIGTRPEVEASVIELLSNIEAASDVFIAGSGSVATSAGIKKVDEIEFFGDSSGSSAVDDARKNGRMWVGRLSITFGVPKVGDIFAGRGYEGDGWSEYGFQYGNVIPLG